MRIGVPREVKPGENRVALTPGGSERLTGAGAEVRVQAGSGEESGFSDAEYTASGARVVPTAAEAWEADLVVKVKEPLPQEFPFLSEASALFTYLHLAAIPALTGILLQRRVTAIAYETVSDGGKLPLLRPMSEVAGILAVQVGARALEKSCGGRGVLLSGAGGAAPSRVVVIGAGTAGRHAARTAAGVGADVVLLDISPEKLARAAEEIPGRLRTALSTPGSVASEVPAADLVISTVLVVGDKAPVLVTREILRRMKRGAAIVDISIDQGGSVETSRPTTHAAPYFIEEGVVHYCVSNMPAAVPRTSTLALTSATLPYLLRLCASGIEAALRDDPALRSGLNTFRGKVTCEGVARALALEYAPPESLL
ncbi:MAG: alanine dehydrogenase [Deltaproteobacteria bacterium]|nr:alanine dehydrogenase [Deltaproteobacteria bacterium]PWB63355.1 MAG: alanine dehydrogenase [Deltaproteobacteria bacterium]